MIIIQIWAVYRPSTGCLLPELRLWVQTEYQDFDNFFATRRAPIPAKPVSMKRSVVGSGTTVVPELMRTLSSRAPTFPKKSEAVLECELENAGTIQRVDHL